MSNPFYPRHILRPDGATVTVTDHVQHSAHMGKLFGPDAQPIEFPKPPTLEEVLAAGYLQVVAEGIVANEAAKAEQGIEPYGEKLASEFVPPSPSEPEPEPLKPGDLITIPVVYRTDPETGLEIGRGMEIETERYTETVPEPEPIVDEIEEPIHDEDPTAEGEEPSEELLSDAPKPKNRGGRPRKVQG